MCRKTGHVMILKIQYFSIFSVGNSSGFKTFVGDTFHGLSEVNEGK